MEEGTFKQVILYNYTFENRNISSLVKNLENKESIKCKVKDIFILSYWNPSPCVLCFYAVWGFAFLASYLISNLRCYIWSNILWNHSVSWLYNIHYDDNLSFKGKLKHTRRTFFCSFVLNYLLSPYSVSDPARGTRKAIVKRRQNPSVHQQVIDKLWDIHSME